MAPSTKLTNKDLLKIEHERSSSYSLESALLVCKEEPMTEISRPQSTEGKLVMTSVPTSKVLGKVKDFLGVMAESNKRLQHNAEHNPDDYDIEVLTGNETEYIEMELALGVADLHTPEAVAAAESAISSHQPVIHWTGASSDSDTEDTDDESDGCDGGEKDEDGNNNTNGHEKPYFPNILKELKSSGKDKSKKRPKIQEV